MKRSDDGPLSTLAVHNHVRGLLESVGGSLAPSIRWVRDRYIEPTRTSLGDASFETARTEGRAMPPVQAIAFARRQALLPGYCGNVADTK
jgi:hypothetical protein